MYASFSSCFYCYLKGINITLDTKEQILAFSKANQSFTDLCFIIRHAQPGESCASVKASECIKPGTNVTFQSENDPVVMTYGRGLCSEPAKQIGKANVTSIFS